MIVLCFNKEVNYQSLWEEIQPKIPRYKFLLLHLMGFKFKIISLVFLMAVKVKMVSAIKITL